MVREVHERIARLFFEGTLAEKIDAIPIEMRPKTSASYRCCLYKDRAMIRFQIMAALGFRVEREEDETRTLASYVAEALQRRRETIGGPVLTVLEEACHRCTMQQYFVTDACQGCLARPCAVGCPKKAISHVNGRAVIDTQACIKCGKCMQVCPYHAIVNVPIPCVEACPVGAITPLPDGGKHFDWGKCINCGKCQKACPFGAVMTRSFMLDVMRALQNPAEKVVALVAPAVAGHMGNTAIWSILAGLKRAGFAEALEVSIGADTTSENEAREFEERFGEGAPPQKLSFMTTSCCPAYVSCIRKHATEIEDAVSHTRSPMHYTAKLAKERWPGCTTVFIGPCTAKIHEAQIDEYTDFALTVIETLSLLRGRGVALDNSQAPPADYECGSFEARNYPLTAGVAGAVAAITTAKVVPVLIDGLNVAAVKKLKSFAKNPPAGNLVEVMACEGGCVAGQGCVAPAQMAQARVKMLLGKSKHHPMARAFQPKAAGAGTEEMKKVPELSTK
uniref:Fe-only hydrogenase 1 n=1 Tax=Mastigamoeba balamuthi TaxID=108607 RepID=A0A0B4R361_MASBA|nr:Fe-only hydrogenase 1 [Mastigamoeba balamuthi]